MCPGMSSPVSPPHGPATVKPEADLRCVAASERVARAKEHRPCNESNFQRMPGSARRIIIGEQLQRRRKANRRRAMRN